MLGVSISKVHSVGCEKVWFFIMFCGQESVGSAEVNQQMGFFPEGLSYSCCICWVEEVVTGSGSQTFNAKPSVHGESPKSLKTLGNAYLTLVYCTLVLVHISTFFNVQIFFSDYKNSTYSL